MGRFAAILNADPTPPHLAFIDPEQRIQSLRGEEPLPKPGDFDAIVVLDTSAWNQLGEMAEMIRGSGKPIIVIDHHANAEEFGTAVFKDASVEATGRLIVDLAEFLEVPISQEMAMPLFAAVATDTGWYRFPSATGDTYRVAGKLVDAGAQPSVIYRKLYEQDSIARVKLRGIALSRVMTEVDGRLAHTYVRTADFEKTGAFPGDTEDFINMALAVAGTEAAVIVIEQPEGEVKASFRSRRGLDCSRIAASFGGGGHKAAAGATLEGPFERAQREVLEAVRAELKLPQT
jgi:phosphoesterase RecJ-like protein